MVAAARTPDDGEIDLTDLERFAHGFPHDVFTRLRREAPVFRQEPTEHTPDGEPFWSLVRWRDVRAAAADSARYSSHTGPGRDDAGGTLIEDLPGGFAAGVLLNCMDDPRHQRIRQLVTPTVAPRALADLEPGLRRRAEAVVDAALARGEVDFVGDVAAELPLQAAADLLGVPQSDRHQLASWADATLAYDDRDLGGVSERSAAASAAMFEYGTALLEAKRSCPAEDVMSIVATGRIAGAGGRLEPLTDLEQQMFFNLLIAAASETTRNSIALGVQALAAHPDQWAALRTDPALVAGAVEEVLRWASSTAYNRRTTTVDLELHGERIPAGAKVVLWWASANRDEAEFVSPFTFDVRRSPNRHLAFGHGSHFCLGAGLARLEIRLVLGALLDRVGAIEPTGPVVHVRTNKHTGVRHMPVRLHPR